MQQLKMFVLIVITLIMSMDLNSIVHIPTATLRIIIRILKETKLMISKNTFVQVMTRLEDLDKKMDKVDNALRDLSPDFGGLYVPEIIDIVVDLLEDVFNDKKDSWLSYPVFDLNWLHDHILGDIEENGEPVDLSSWDKVYDFLIKNMED
jgi:hypothetical protein